MLSLEEKKALAVEERLYLVALQSEMVFVCSKTYAVHNSNECPCQKKNMRSGILYMNVKYKLDDADYLNISRI